MWQQEYSKPPTHSAKLPNHSITPPSSHISVQATELIAQSNTIHRTKNTASEPAMPISRTRRNRGSGNCATAFMKQSTMLMQFP